MAKQTWARLGFLLTFLLGLGLILFPLVSQIAYYRASRVQVQEFDQGVDQIDRTEINRRLDLAQAYNETVDGDNLCDPFTQRQKEGRAEYARMLEVNEQIGYVTIPAIDQRLSVYAGTNEAVLQKGVGHLEGTSLPVGGPSTHAVITAHRGLPTARLFTDLDKLEVGDIFYYSHIGGDMAYQVDHIQVIEPDDFEAVAVDPGQDYMTLLTCTPYMINSHRLIVRGQRIPIPEDPVQEPKLGWPLEFVLPLSLVVTILITVIYHWIKKRTRKGSSKS